MSESSEPQYARVERPFGWEIPIIHCPICGKATMVLFLTISLNIF